MPRFPKTPFFLFAASILVWMPVGHAQLPAMNPLAGEVLTGTDGSLSGVPTKRPEGRGATNLEKWWNGPGLLQGRGNPFFDFRNAASDRGLDFQANYRGAFLGVLASEGGQRGFYDQNIDFGCSLDFDEFLGNGMLDGFSAFVTARYRDSWPESNANTVVMANTLFAPTSWQSGTQFRLMNFGLEFGSRNLLPVEDMVVVRLGWLQPQREFLDQPLSKLFLNNAITSRKGIGSNVPFGGSFSTWGGTIDFHPTESFYVKNGLFMSYPNATSSSNHGLAFEGYAPDPSLNGLYYLGETGVLPDIGPSKLPGRYAFGGYFFGTPNGQTSTWSGSQVDGRYGFYFQADQMIFRESLDEKAKKADLQGLRTFNMLTFAPGFAIKNQYPFYFQSGLVYKGLVPSRDKDVLLAALGYGAYQGDVKNPPATYSAVFESGYRWQINGWSYVQPFFQYIIRPDGTDDVSNAAILGVLTGLVF